MKTKKQARKETIPKTDKQKARQHSKFLSIIAAQIQTLVIEKTKNDYYPFYNLGACIQRERKQLEDILTDYCGRDDHLAIKELRLKQDWYKYSLGKWRERLRKFIGIEIPVRHDYETNDRITLEHYSDDYKKIEEILISRIRGKKAAAASGLGSSGITPPVTKDSVLAGQPKPADAKQEITDESQTGIEGGQGRSRNKPKQKTESEKPTQRLTAQINNDNNIRQHLEDIQASQGRMEAAVLKQAELAAGASSGGNIKKKKGRSTIKGKEAKWRIEVFEAWQRAREAGVPLPEFCNDVNQKGILIDGAFTKPNRGEELDADMLKTFSDWYRTQKVTKNSTNK